METELKLQKHDNFTEAEKAIILKALYECEKEYKTTSPKKDIINNNDILYYFCIATTEAIGLCIKLKYRLNNYLYLKLFDLYHKPNFYKANNLLVQEESVFNHWWPKDDIESRLKAIELLRKAVKDD